MQKVLSFSILRKVIKTKYSVRDLKKLEDIEIAKLRY